MQERIGNLKDRRRAMRHLLQDGAAADAMAAYYALHHPDDKTVLVLHPEEAEIEPDIHADGYICMSRTGIDLFRPLVTMRLPTDKDPAATLAAAELIGRALGPGRPVILSIPARYRPLVGALFDIDSEERLRLLALDPARYEPIVNVLVTRSTSPGGYPQFTIRSSESGEEEVVASASLNWQSPRYGEIAVNTRPQYRRQGRGRSVVAALSGHLLDSGRIPLYVVSEENTASAALAESVGFTDTGVREHLIQGTLKERIEGVNMS